MAALHLGMLLSMAEVPLGTEVSMAKTYIDIQHSMAESSEYPNQLTQFFRDGADRVPRIDLIF